MSAKPIFAPRSALGAEVTFEGTPALMWPSSSQMDDVWILVDLCVTFARIALIAVGGMQSGLSEVYREVVEVRGWMTAAELADLIALAQASPGPNGLFS